MEDVYYTLNQKDDWLASSFSILADGIGGWGLAGIGAATLCGVWMGPDRLGKEKNKKKEARILLLFSYSCVTPCRLSSSINYKKVRGGCTPRRAII